MVDHPDKASDAHPSRSERKREAERLQHLGQRITELKPSDLALIPLPEDMITAISTYRKINSFEARRRQLQFIGKLMRRTDSEPILEALDKLDGSSAAARYEFHQLELWRERLMEDPQALTDYLTEHPTADRQRLRQQLSRIARANDETQRKSAAKALFRLLREFEDG